ncbi:MAG: hypothetical protein M5R36_06225 [Deltaproteobacteria bacterium]|nr:hypothetical protein [Deltaproteobacteria bacterium]
MFAAATDSNVSHSERQVIGAPRLAGDNQAAAQSANPIDPDSLPIVALTNPAVILAVSDLAQAWSAKYGSVWEKDGDGNWEYGPHNWCSEGGLWFFRRTAFVGDFLFPIPPQKEVGISTWVELFMRKNRYICGRNFAWEEIPAYVWPGFFVSTREMGHATIFLYWTQPPTEEDPFNEKDPGKDRRVGAFNPKAKLNRFRNIGANQSQKVSISNTTIVRADDRDDAEKWLHLGQDVPVEEDGKEKDYPNTLVVWRDGVDYAFADVEQDGFAVTFGKTLNAKRNIYDADGKPKPKP